VQQWPARLVGWHHVFLKAPVEALFGEDLYGFGGGGGGGD